MVQSPLSEAFKQQRDYENYGISLFRTFWTQLLALALILGAPQVSSSITYRLYPVSPFGVLTGDADGPRRGCVSGCR